MPILQFEGIRGGFYISRYEMAISLHRTIAITRESQMKTSKVR